MANEGERERMIMFFRLSEAWIPDLSILIVVECIIKDVPSLRKT